MKKAAVILAMIAIIAATITLMCSTGVFNSENRQLNIGIKLLNEGKYEQAILSFEKVIVISSKSVKARLGLAKAYYQLNDFDNAEKYLIEAQQIEPNNSQVNEFLHALKIKIMEKQQEELLKKADIAGNTGQIFEQLDDKFVPLGEIILDSDFPKPDFADYPVKISAKHNLYKYSTSDIHIESTNFEQVIRVNNINIKTNMENFTGADIVDLDIKDDYKEIALYAEGPSGDPSIQFLRYDGKKLFSLGEVYGYYDAKRTDAEPCYGAVWVNQKGGLISPWQNIGFTNPRIALAYYVIQGNQLIYKTIAGTPSKEKIFDVNDKFKAWFTPVASEPVNYGNADYMQEYRQDNMKEFKVGQKIKILGLKDNWNYYSFYVEIDGQTGILAFWQGD